MSITTESALFGKLVPFAYLIIALRSSLSEGNTNNYVFND